MTLRDYFAAKVLPAVFAVAEGELHHASIASISYKLADAMLKERAK